LWYRFVSRLGPERISALCEFEQVGVEAIHVSNRQAIGGARIDFELTTTPRL
jgi:hypothetical protein